MPEEEKVYLLQINLPELNHNLLVLQFKDDSVLTILPRSMFTIVFVETIAIAEQLVFNALCCNFKWPDYGSDRHRGL